MIPRKSLFEPVGSRKAQLSIDIDKGVVLLRYGMGSSSLLEG